MPLSIKHPEADRLARELAARTGQSLTDAVVMALREQLRRTPGAAGPALAEELLAIGRRCAALPVLDSRSPEAVIGYDDAGLPGGW
ncbi:MAG: type II toxin-antitoxin system VapB family antitoxin [Pseudomonadota bacterium]|nr:type II toxin-antitoxin system VapB family antitoxin [Pseudomonadota bacterium]